MWARLFRNGDYEGNPGKVRNLDDSADVADFCKAATDSEAFKFSLSAIDSSLLEVFAPGVSPEYIRYAMNLANAPEDFQLNRERIGPLPANLPLNVETTGDTNSKSYYTIVAPDTTIVAGTYFA